MSNGATTVAELAYPSHSCLIYDTPDEQQAVLCEFLSRGLTRGERCVFLEKPERIQMVRKGLAEKGIDVEEEEGRGALIFSSDHEYLDEGHFKEDRMLQFLDRAVKEALAQGFSALRASGDLNWQLGEDQDFSQLIHYEARLDQFVSQKPIVGLCQYHRQSMPGTAIRNALETHLHVVLGELFCTNNLYYEPPDIRLGSDKTQDKRAEWMCRRLQQAMKVERQRDSAIQSLLHQKERPS